MRKRPFPRGNCLPLAVGMVAILVSGCSLVGDDSKVQTTRVAYGQGSRSQSGDLSVPSDADAELPVVMLIHGGWWRPGNTHVLMEGLAEDLTSKGWAVWNVDYRLVGEGGGWPATYEDIAAAIDHLAALAEPNRLDLSKVIVVGHSAGGSLALWAAARSKFKAGQPGANPKVVPQAVVSLGGVLNLASTSIEGLGGGAVDEFMGQGTLNSGDDRYRLASPIELLPLGRTTLIVHGREDQVIDIGQADAFVDRARVAGDDVTADTPAGVDHLDVIDPDSKPWARTQRWMREQVS